MGKSKKSGRKCSMCRQPVVGHTGKIGLECPNVYTPPDSEFETKAEEARRKREAEKEKEKKKETNEEKDGKKGGDSSGDSGKKKGGDSSGDSGKKGDEGGTSSSDSDESSVDEEEAMEFLKKKKKTHEKMNESDDMREAILGLTKQMMTLTKQVGSLHDNQIKLAEEMVEHKRNGAVGGQSDYRESGSIATPRRVLSNGAAMNSGADNDDTGGHTRESTVPLYSVSNKTSGIPGLRSVPDSIDPRQLNVVPGIPEKTIRMALCGEFIFIEHFLGFMGAEAESNFELISDDTGRIEARQRRPRRQIFNIFTWLEAWQNYERLMVNYHGLAVYNLMNEYKIKMIEWDRGFIWAAVQNMDAKHRSRIGGKSVDFMDIDAVMITSNLNHNSAKPSTKAPFRATPTGYGRRSQDRNDNYSFVCHQWNDNRCGFTNCKKWHICKGCGGEMPFIQCEKSGRCARTGQAYPRN